MSGNTVVKMSGVKEGGNGGGDVGREEEKGTGEGNIVSGKGSSEDGGAVMKENCNQETIAGTVSNGVAVKMSLFQEGGSVRRKETGKDVIRISSSER